jgi:hypothetical protein
MRVVRVVILLYMHTCRVIVLLCMRVVLAYYYTCMRVVRVVILRYMHACRDTTSYYYIQEMHSLRLQLGETEGSAGTDFYLRYWYKSTNTDIMRAV